MATCRGHLGNTIPPGPTATGNNVISDDADPFWLPLGTPEYEFHRKNFTPPFPAYPSGTRYVRCSRVLHITRRFYGVTSHSDDCLFDGITLVSDELNGISRDNKGTVRPKHVRSFPGGLWQMIIENGL